MIIISIAYRIFEYNLDKLQEVLPMKISEICRSGLFDTIWIFPDNFGLWPYFQNKNEVKYWLILKIPDHRKQCQGALKCADVTGPREMKDANCLIRLICMICGHFVAKIYKNTLWLQNVMISWWQTWNSKVWVPIPMDTNTSPSTSLKSHNNQRLQIVFSPFPPQMTCNSLWSENNFP